MLSLSLSLSINTFLFLLLPLSVVTSVYKCWTFWQMNHLISTFWNSNNVVPKVSVWRHSCHSEWGGETSQSGNLLSAESLKLSPDGPPQRQREEERKKESEREEKEMSALVVTFHWQRKPPLWHVVDKCQRPVNSLQINCLSSCRRAVRPVQPQQQQHTDTLDNHSRNVGTWTSAYGNYYRSHAC